MVIMTDKMPGKDGTEIISKLLAVPFKMNSPDSQLQVLKQNRPRDTLCDIKKEKPRSVHAAFNEKWYETYNWLCGSSSLNKLFCWPCLLMRPETSTWCSTGVDDFAKFPLLATKHSTGKSHIKAITEYDGTLIEVGMLPEFSIESKQNVDGDQRGSDSDSDQLGRFLAPKGPISSATTPKPTTSPYVLPEKQTLTFQAWQQANQSFINGSDEKLLRRRRRLARIEIKNAQLMSQKLRLEIRLLEGQLELQALQTELRTQKQPDVPDAT